MKVLSLRRPRGVRYSSASIVTLSAGAFLVFCISGFSAVPGLFGGETVSTLGEVDYSIELAISELPESTSTSRAGATSS